MRNILIILVVIAILVGGLWFVFSGKGPDISGLLPDMFASSAGSERAPGDTGEPYVVPALKNEYRNQRFGFALSVPEGFTAAELPQEDDGSYTVLLQNSNGQGIQILVTPYPSDTRVLTADQIRADIPDMKLSDVQAVEIGPEHKGVAFLSDNEAFAGSSREVWFVFRGNLYQVSTYAYLDDLLKTMFGTWQFF